MFLQFVTFFVFVFLSYLPYNLHVLLLAGIDPGFKEILKEVLTQVGQAFLMAGL
jgi:hypothetical protein